MGVADSQRCSCKLHWSRNGPWLYLALLTVTAMILAQCPVVTASGKLYSTSSKRWGAPRWGHLESFFVSPAVDGLGWFNVVTGYNKM